MTFKEQIRADLNIFMNTDEFAVLHTVNGKKMPVTVDNNELIERAKKAKSDMDGIFTKSTLIFVKAKDFGSLPAIGAALNLDGRTYIVTDAMNEDGLFSIHLEAATS
jgi:hypothetical protein